MLSPPGPLSKSGEREGTLGRLSRTIITGDGFIEPCARRYGSPMGGVRFLPLAVLLTLVSAALAEQQRKPRAVPKEVSREAETAAPEPHELVAFLQMNPEEKFDL